MTFRIYLRQLRPVRTLLMTAVYSFFVWSWVHTLHIKSSHAADGFWIGAVGIPLCFGCFFSSPLHEIIHKPFFLLLPGARRSLPLWHVGALAYGALLSSFAALLFDPSLPFVGVFGMAAFFSALPLLRRFGQNYFVYNLGLIFVLAGVIYSKVEWPRNLIVNHPGTVLVVGLVLAYRCLRQCFSHRSLRARAMEPYAAIQSTLFSRGVMRQERALAQKKLFSKNTKRMKFTWPRTPVLSSEDDWHRASLYSQTGLSTGGRILRLCVYFPFGVCLGVFAIVLVFGYFLNKPIGLQWIAENLARTGSLDFNLSKDEAFIQRFPLILIPIFGLFGSMARQVQRYALPVSRNRMARIDFFLSVRGAAISFLIPLLSMILISWSSALFARAPFTWNSVATYASIMLLLLPGVPLMLCTTLIPKAWPRFLIAIFAIYALVAACFFLIFSYRLSIVSPLVITISVAVTAAGLTLFWKLLKRRYTTTDLLQQANDLYLMPVA